MKNEEEKRFKVLVKRRRDLLDQVPELIRIIRGCFLERYSTCSRAGCRCHDGEKHGPRKYVVVTEDKRQKQHYIPQGEEELVVEGIQQYQELCTIVQKVTAINLELMRLGMLGRDT